MCKEYGVKGYPTLIYFPPGEKVENKPTMCRYTGGRVLNAFKEYAIEGKGFSVDACEPIPGAPVEKQEEL